MAHERRNDSGPWSQASLALCIPSLLAAGPLVGWGLAWLIGWLTGWHSHWLTAGLIVAGMMAGVRETIKVIGRLK